MPMLPNKMQKFSGLTGGMGGQAPGANMFNLQQRMGDRPKGMAGGGNPPGINRETMAEISKLMMPEVDNPFEMQARPPQQGEAPPMQETPMPPPAPRKKPKHKRGGVAKKALLLAKRHRRGGRKR
jgi:hypothetical protein